MLEIGELREGNKVCDVTWFVEPRDTVSGSVHNGAATMVCGSWLPLRLLVAKVRIPLCGPEQEKRRPRTLLFLWGRLAGKEA